MKILFPEISPFHCFFLETESNHQVYVEQSGNPTGMPVIFLHGGPCSGTKPDHRRFFNPAHYHIILLDQRGCGQSLPFGELENNTTQDLLRDMEHIRQQLHLEKWLLFGGSWGAALALLYAQLYPARVSGMILRGVFLARQTDMDWFLGNGVNRIYPQQWQALKNSVPPEFHENVAQGLYAAVFGENAAIAGQAALQWQAWSGLVALGNAYRPDPNPMHEQTLRQVQMELHYARHNYFIAENQILNNCDVLQAIPTIIIHGQNDLTCPLESSWSLHQALPKARFIVLPNAGHIARGEEMIAALVCATEEMLKIL